VTWANCALPGWWPGRGGRLDRAQLPGADRARAYWFDTFSALVASVLVAAGPWLSFPAVAVILAGVGFWSAALGPAGSRVTRSLLTVTVVACSHWRGRSGR
jgi:hypothetical protein